jgi:hypothetical protein
MKKLIPILLILLATGVNGQWFNDIPEYNPDSVLKSEKLYVQVYSDSLSQYRFFDLFELIPQGGTDTVYVIEVIRDTVTMIQYDSIVKVDTIYVDNCPDPDPEPEPDTIGYWPGPAQPDFSNVTTVYVTNLNDDGPGSFRYAFELPFPRRIIPDTTGTIRLQSEIRITNPHCWYDGPSGPPPGLLVLDGGIWVQTHDVAITGLHDRLGDQYNGKGRNCISILHGSHHVVIHGNSFLWGVDQIMGTNGYYGGPGDVADISNITITENIFAEALSYVEGPEPEHSKGLLGYFDTKNILIKDNLFVRNRDRNPLLEGGVTGVIANNMSYWGDQPMSICFWRNPITGESVHHVVDIIGNKSSGFNSGYQIRFYDFDYTNSRIYMEGNNGPNDDWDTDSIWGNPHESTVRVHTPNFNYPGVVYREANEAEKYVLENAGAFPQHRCATDQRIIDIYKNKPYGDVFYRRGEGNENLVDSPDQVGWDLFE